MGSSLLLKIRNQRKNASTGGSIPSLATTPIKTSRTKRAAEADDSATGELPHETSRTSRSALRYPVRPIRMWTASVPRRKKVTSAWIVRYEGSAFFTRSMESSTPLRYSSRDGAKGAAMEFHVIWEVNIDADNPMAAAQEARALQLKTYTSATVFGVWEPAAGKMHRIDVAGDTETMERAELDAVRAALRSLQCKPDVLPNIQNVAVTMLIFLDREDMIFRRIG